MKNNENDKNDRMPDRGLLPLSFVSHELGTPLAAISGWANLLRSGRLTAEQSERAIDGILRAVKLQRRLLDDLRDFSQVAAGHMSLERRPIDLAAVVQEAIELVRPQADEKHVTLRMRFPSVRHETWGDSERLQQVVWNLLSNSIKFSKRHGQVEVQITNLDRHFVLTVRDWGTGIPVAFLPRIFEPFEQARDSARAEKGMGLGLAITRHIVDLHGGTITIENNQDGAGVVTSVQLPRLCADPHIGELRQG